MKKHQFYSMVAKKGKKTVVMQNGYTDGEFNYYRHAGGWYCIDPATGYSIVSSRTRQEAQQSAQGVREKFEELKTKESYKKRVDEFKELRSAARIVVTFAV